MHCQYLSTFCRDLVCCLVSCADATIPLASDGKRVAGWKDEIPQFKKRSLFWNHLWYESGYPQAVVLFQLRKHVKAHYEYAVRRVMRNQDTLRHAKLADALSLASLGIVGRKCEVAVVGNRLLCTLLMVSVVMRIWLSSGLESVYISSPKSSHLLAQALVDLEVSVEDMNSFSADSVSAALNKLKHGK